MTDYPRDEEDVVVLLSIEPRSSGLGSQLSEHAGYTTENQVSTTVTQTTTVVIPGYARIKSEFGEIIEENGGDQIKHLQAKLQQAQGKISKLDAQIEEAEDFSAKLQGKILVLETQIKDDQDLAAEAEGRMSEMEKQLSEEMNHARQARRLATETQAKLHEVLKHPDQQLREMVMSLEWECDNMKVTIKNQENQIRQFQSLAFEGLNGGTWAAGDDTTIRAELESLQCNIKAWARKYAIDDMNSIKEIPANNYEIFLKALGNVVRLRTRKDELGCLQTSPMNKKAPTICLQALLSHRIYANIIKEPFFALGKRGRVLQSVYVDMKKANEKEAHIWRSRTIRLLSTPPATRTMGGGGGDNRQQSQDHEFALGLKDASQAVTNYFFDSPAKHLIRPSAFSPDNFSQTCSDMDSLVQQAALISFKLWSRRTALYLLGLPDLKDKSFSVVSDFMKAHPLHRLHDDDDKCNGFSVIIVTQPAVIGYGSSDGRDYSKSTERVWMKAEVLLSETAKI